MLYIDKNVQFNSNFLKQANKITVIVIAFILVLSNITFALADDNVYQTASDYDYYPFTFIEDDIIQGFSIDLLNAAAEAAGIELNYTTGEWNEIKTELIEGTIDVLPIMGYTEERDEYLDFSIPYIVMKGNIFIREDNTEIETLSDLYDKQIIVMEGDIAEDYAISMGLEDNLITVSTLTEGFELLSSGQYDALLAHDLVGDAIIQALNIKNIRPAAVFEEDSVSITKTNLEGFEQKFCFAVKEGDSELLAKLNEGLVSLSTDGTYKALYDKWLTLAPEEQSIWDTISPLLIYIIPAVILLLLAAVLYVNLQVRQKKRELEKSNKALLMIEAHLLQKQKLESIGVLASGVAHEINNPINGVMNYSQLIHDLTDNDDEDFIVYKDEIRDYSQMITEETLRVASIVRTLLNFSRTEKRNLSKAEIKTIIEGVSSLASVIIKRNNIILEINIGSSLPVIECRSQQIQQVLINLITNAKDALNAKYPDYDINKKIIISVKKYEINDAPGIRITVEDHGAGIPEDVQKKIFDPFYTTKERSSGTGLGLAISYNIADEHNGSLSYETKFGEYTKFFLDLPAKQIKDD